jgi:putative membrane protein
MKKDQMKNDTTQQSLVKDQSLAKELFMGFCLGTANIIPGVSGGTFLLVFKIYERVFAILNRINRALVLRFAAIVFCVVKNLGRNGCLQDLASFLKETDAVFLLKLMVGAVTAIVALSSLMKYLLVHQFAYTYSLFFGLILVSIVIPVRMLNSLKGPVVFMVLLGMSLTVFVSWSVNPYDKVKIKSDHLERQFQHISGENKAPVFGQGSHGNPLENQLKKKEGKTQEPGQFSFLGKYTIEEYVYAGICGAVSISAMVLPGISGSLVLILMGAYFDVISAISALKSGHLDTLAFLCCFGLGIVVGGLLFARLINFVLKRYYNLTMAFLVGLMAGSLHALWPFKKVMIMARQYVKQEGAIFVVENSQVYTNLNILPSNGHQLLVSLLFFFVGCAVMVAFVRAESS